MYWYNPATRTSERVQAPSTDEQAVQLLAGTPDSAEFIGEYLELRHSGSPIEQALVLVGHEFRLREPERQLILRDSGVASAQQRMPTNFGEFPFHALR
jgi:hypothetical protein